MSTADWLPAYQGVPTFMRCPLSRPDAGTAVVVVGVPCDRGSSSFRTGARFGPRKLREASLLLWGYNAALGVAPLDVLRVVDCGDLEVAPGDTEEMVRRVTEAAIELIRTARLVALGGDHSISLPLLRAHARRYGPLAVLHLDAHADLWEGRLDHGTSYRHALEEGLVDPAAYVQVGIRGPLCSAADATAGQRWGALVISAAEVHDEGGAAAARRARERLAARPVYLSLDLDVADPAYAPGVSTPEVGGLTSHQLLVLLRAMRGLEFIGMDIVELAPPYDPTEVTAILGANLVFEFLSLLALGR